jgi:predicted dehydrogenase
MSSERSGGERSSSSTGLTGPTGIVIGAGDRGANAYVPLLLEEPGLASIVGVAERDVDRREAFAKRFGLSADACFADARSLFERPRRADFALIATQDSHHVEPALAALEAGYHVLLEKPMAVDEADCERLVETSERTGRLLQICHVLRHAPLYRAIKRAIDSGELGEILTIQHSENVSYWHYAHSYCRGHWRNRTESSPMILAKSCHDLDLLHWLSGAAPIRLTSIERETWLREENVPPDAPAFCIDGCPHADRCPYDAVSMYRDLTPLLLDLRKKSRPLPDAEQPEDVPRAAGWQGWPVSVMTADTTPEGVERALRETRYGRCVYRVGDNDQPASQHVDIQFANGVNASFSMHSTSHREGRETRIDGTRGTLVAGFFNTEQHATVFDHKSGRQRTLQIDSQAGHHGGSDFALFRSFIAAVGGAAPPETTARDSLWSHRMAFAADRCARAGSVANWPAS